MKSPEGENNIIGAVETSFSIVELLREERSSRLTDIADALDLPKSTAHSHLATLEKQGLVVRSPTGYELGLRFASIGESAKQKKPEYEIVRKRVDKLASDTGERSNFITEEHGYTVYLHVAAGENAVVIGGNVGDRANRFHASAAGKSILANLSDESRERIMSELDLVPFTDNTITETDVLREELGHVRERGVAFNHEELMVGLRAISVPVKYPDGELLGTIGISGPTHRLQDERFEDELPSTLLGTANEIELNIGQSLY